MGSDKGGVRRGDLFNGVYAMGKMTEDRMNYTGERVVEVLPAGEQAMTLAWTPVVGSVKVLKADGTEVPFELVDANLYFDKRLNPFHVDAETSAYQGALADPDDEENPGRPIQLDPYMAVPDKDANGWRGGYGTVSSTKQEKKLAVLLNNIADTNLRVAYIYEICVA